MTHPTVTNSQRRFIASLLAISLILLMAPAAWGGETWHSTPGTACAAFNNNQANLLERSHVRIYNPPSNPQSLWVICPMQRVEEDILSTAGLVYGYVNVYFDSMSAPNAEVTCVAREFDDGSTHVPGGITNGVENAITATASRSFTVPGVSNASWNFTYDDTSVYSYWTFTCRLAPGTGINSIDVRQH